MKAFLKYLIITASILSLPIIGANRFNLPYWAVVAITIICVIVMIIGFVWEPEE